MLSETKTRSKLSRSDYISIVSVLLLSAGLGSAILTIPDWAHALGLLSVVLGGYGMFVMDVRD